MNRRTLNSLLACLLCASACVATEDAPHIADIEAPEHVLVIDEALVSDAPVVLEADRILVRAEIRDPGRSCLRSCCACWSLGWPGAGASSDPRDFV